MSANSIQIGGEHYKTKAIQPWDFIAANELGYMEGCIVKYVSRYKYKGGLEDLQKAMHYLSKLVEIEKAKQPKAPKPALGLRKDGKPKKRPGRPKKVVAQPVETPKE